MRFKPLRVTDPRLVILLTAACVSLFAVGGSAAREHRASFTERATLVHIYRPFDGRSIDPTLHVRRQETGYCWTGSEVALHRHAAWRCMWGGRFILDPCFSAPWHSPGYVVCPSQAWNRSVIRLNLSRHLPPPDDNTDRVGSVWAITTAGGLHCERRSGQIPLVSGKPLLYGCGKDGALVGEPNMAKPVWTILFSSAARPRHLTRVAVVAAWL